MKNKVLYTEVIKAAEGLARALRNYTDEPMYMHLAIFTRDEESHHEGDPDGLPDFYSLVVHSASEEYFEENLEPTISTSARVYYKESKDGELIRTVIPYYEDVAEDDEDEQG